MDTRTVAMWRDLTNGVSPIANAKIRWLYIQAVTRSGLYFAMVVTSGAIVGGGRGVNRPLSKSGDFTSQGSVTEAVSVMMEKMTREREPTRPTSPSLSVDSEVEASAV